MDSPSSVSSYSSYSLSPSFSTSPVNSDFGFPSDSEREDKGAHGPRPDTVGQRGGSRSSPGPIRCRHRTKVSGNQHTASHSEQRGSGVKRTRAGELETSLNIQGCTTEGDLLFAQKCKELQGFIRPLTDLLNGLKMGRFERGLSSFQQSVAMDRIQRIVGVLQKPQMGERYLGTLLQVEGMLKIWFPHITAQKASLGSSKHQLIKHFPSHHSDSTPSSPAPPVEKMDQTQLGHLVFKPNQPWHFTQWPAMNLTWIHTTPICNPPLGSPGVKSSPGASSSFPPRTKRTFLWFPRTVSPLGPDVFAQRWDCVTSSSGRERASCQLSPEGAGLNPPGARGDPAARPCSSSLPPPENASRW
ncbi:circadian-associated transcriptional repressor isoform X2 [Castor canadensis]|uniref:Circadian-associated transcriptional repressor isoform X2 n=1 Tax=Castor canadensis TaxID=51338 RepID=A0AC58KH97_CASCN